MISRLKTSHHGRKRYQRRTCRIAAVKGYQGRKCRITVVKRYQGRKCFITKRKMVSRWKITMVGWCYHRNILLDMSQPHQTIRLHIILKQTARHNISTTLPRVFCCTRLFLWAEHRGEEWTKGVPFTGFRNIAWISLFEAYERVRNLSLRSII